MWAPGALRDFTADLKNTVHCDVSSLWKHSPEEGGIANCVGDGMVCEGFREEVLPKQGFEG